MSKKITSIAMALVLCLLMRLTAFATSSDDYYENLDGWNIITYTSNEQLSMLNTDNDVVVLTESQMLELKDSVKEIFDTAEMIYILTDMSVNDIQSICHLPSLIHSEDASLSKFATAIVQMDDGNYAFHDVSVLYTDDADNQSGFNTSTLQLDSNVSESQMIYDGLDAIFNTDATEVNAASQTAARMQANGFYATSKDSAVVYDSHGNRVGTMGYTTYWYKIVKSGTKRIFDVICISTFAPDTGYVCANMSVYLGTSEANHEVLEAANIISNGQAYTHSLSLSASKTGLSGAAETSWSYDINAQTVTKSFDMTTNDRTWTFKPKSAGNGDAWIEEPGIRMYSTQEKCYTKVQLSCPFVTIFGIHLQENYLSKNWYMTY